MHDSQSYTYGYYIVRELPEPILAEFSSRFEEAAAIQNVRSREVSLLTLVEKLPVLNRIILAWTMIHLDNITFNVLIHYFYAC